MRATTVVCVILGIAAVACVRDEVPLPLAPFTARGAMAFSPDRTPWSEPVRLDAPVNLPTSNEQAPAISPDGLSLYFCSNRPPSLGNDLWVSTRLGEDAPWGEPVNLGPVVNGPMGDCGPSLSDDGLLLFFTSARPGSANNDIYVSARSDATDNLSWSAPVRLGPEVNTDAFEFSPVVTRRLDDGSAELHFERGDRIVSSIFVARVDASGMALGDDTVVEELSAPGTANGRATIRYDGREMLLFSNRNGGTDLFVATRQSPAASWSMPVRVDELSVSPQHEIHPYLSRDGRSVYFVRGSGTANDIWVATRHPSGR